jgi:hypothetical protein
MIKIHEIASNKRKKISLPFDIYFSWGKYFLRSACILLPIAFIGYLAVFNKNSHPAKLDYAGMGISLFLFFSLPFLSG